MSMTTSESISVPSTTRTAALAYRADGIDGARLAAEWLPITASIVISSVLAMAATALTIRWVMKLMHIEG